MKRHGIPTAAYETFDSYVRAKQYLESLDYRVVIKVDGLAAGKGVVLPVDKEDAYRAPRRSWYMANLDQPVILWLLKSIWMETR